ncbi:hypothetical protein AB0O68_15705 [Streptomyces sp. NPDC087512]|uniref:hypothetical protein n=1 Tax=Streptomyces sp. NPDC087512 TaxID=3155059 RepID=UPI0034275862
MTSEVIRYRNANNGDVVERQHPDARLEMLPNWERLEEPAPSGASKRPRNSPATKPAAVEEQEKGGEDPAV